MKKSLLFVSSNLVAEITTPAGGLLRIFNLLAAYFPDVSTLDMKGSNLLVLKRYLVSIFNTEIKKRYNHPKLEK